MWAWSWHTPLPVGQRLRRRGVGVGDARHVVDPVAHRRHERMQPLERVLPVDAGGELADGRVGRRGRRLSLRTRAAGAVSTRPAHEPSQSCVSTVPPRVDGELAVRLAVIVTRCTMLPKPSRNCSARRIDAGGISMAQLTTFWPVEGRRRQAQALDG